MQEEEREQRGKENEAPNWNGQEEDDAPSGLGSTPVDPEPLPTQSALYTCRTAPAIDRVRHWLPARGDAPPPMAPRVAETHSNAYGRRPAALHL